MCSWTGNGKHTSWESPAKTKAVCLKGEGGGTSTIIWINHSTLQPPISSYRYFLSGSLKGRHSTKTTFISTNLYFEIQYVPINNKQYTLTTTNHLDQSPNTSTTDQFQISTTLYFFLSVPSLGFVPLLARSSILFFSILFFSILFYSILFN